MRPFRSWRPRGKMYSLKCNQCGQGFLSSYQLEAPICGKCLQKAKSLDSTIEHEKHCLTCGAQGVIYGKEYCHSCYFGFGKKQRMNAWVRSKGIPIVAKSFAYPPIYQKYFESIYDSLAESIHFLKVFFSDLSGPILQKSFSPYLNSKNNNNKESAFWSDITSQPDEHAHLAFGHLIL